MQFTSIPFYIFLCVVVVSYYVLSPKYRNYLLLAASYYFYFSIQPEYLILLLASTLVNYILGRSINVYKAHKNILLGLGLVFNLGILFYFKYFVFFGEQLNLLFSKFSLNLNVPQHSLILPIGISFYTFMAMGYILDVYWGDIKSQKNLTTFSIYLAFFPQILCGPIGRAKNLFKQYTEVHPLLYSNFSNGFRLVLWGLFKKMVVADNLGAYVDAVYNNIPMHSTLTLIVTALMYPLQLYADFGGYTDIARGVGKLFGFDLMVNFRTPYVNSTSVTDYWKRNHISLTSWLKDYVFFPFMGTSSSKLRIYAGILIMFLASGIWHGVGWMFLIWGSIQALYLIVEDIVKWDKLGRGKSFYAFCKKILTYCFISVSLIFFRIPSFGQVIDFFNGLSKLNWSYYIGTTRLVPPILVCVPIIIFIELLVNDKQIDQYLTGKPFLLRWCGYLAIFFIILLFGNLNGSSFIYYEF